MLLRDANGDGKPEAQSVFLDHLNSPFGVALVGDDSLRRRHRRDPALSLQRRATRRSPAPATSSRAARRPDRPSLDQEPGRQPRRLEALCRRRLEQQHHRERNEAEKNRAAIWEVDRATGAHAHLRERPAQSERPDLRAESDALWAVVNERDELGPNLVPDYMTSVKDGALLRLALQLLRPARRSARAAAAARPGRQTAIPPDYALSSHVAPLGLAFYTGRQASRRNIAGGAFVGEHGSWDRPELQRLQGRVRAFTDGKPERQGPGRRDRLPRRTARRAAGRSALASTRRRAADRRRRRQHGVARDAAGAPGAAAQR